MACFMPSIIVRTEDERWKMEKGTLIAYHLLESRTGAYIEWLENKLIMVANNNINKDSLLVLLSAKRKPADHKVLHIPWSQEMIPTSRISLASTLCTQGLFTPIAGNA